MVLAQDGRIVGEALCSGYAILTTLLLRVYLEKAREHKEACPYR